MVLLNQLRADVVAYAWAVLNSNGVNPDSAVRLGNSTRDHVNYYADGQGHHDLTRTASWEGG